MAPSATSLLHLNLLSGPVMAGYKLSETSVRLLKVQYGVHIDLWTLGSSFLKIPGPPFKKDTHCISANQISYPVNFVACFSHKEHSDLLPRSVGRCQFHRWWHVNHAYCSQSVLEGGVRQCDRKTPKKWYQVWVRDSKSASALLWTALLMLTQFKAYYLHIYKLW